MSKKVLVVVCALITAVVMTACSGKALPEGFEKEEVIKNAKEVAAQLSEKDYAGVVAKFSSVMEGLDEETLAESTEGKLEEIGKFETFSSESVTGGSSEKTGDFATVILVCDHENGSVTYTISFDKEGKICGLYMK